MTVLVGGKRLGGAVGPAAGQVHRTDDTASQPGRLAQLGRDQNPDFRPFVGNLCSMNQDAAPTRGWPAADLDRLASFDQQAGPRLLQGECVIHAAASSSVQALAPARRRARVPPFYAAELASQCCGKL